eukprot:688242-Rhodomonas_salina.2
MKKKWEGRCWGGREEGGEDATSQPSVQLWRRQRGHKLWSGCRSRLHFLQGNGVRPRKRERQDSVFRSQCGILLT